MTDARSQIGFVEPMMALLVQKLPEGPQWSYEVKLDGFRTLIVQQGGTVQLRSRNNKDLTRDFAQVARAARQLTTDTALIDGEIVAVDETGVPRFQMLQHRSTTKPAHIVFYAFDLLLLNGRDVTRMPLDERRAMLAPVIAQSGLYFSEPLDGTPDQLVEAATRLQLEGIVAKRRDSTYEPGRRSGAWQKLRLRISQAFVVGGFSPGAPFDSIVVGYYAGTQLMFASRVRAGFTAASRRQLFARIKNDVVDACPFANLPSRKSGGWNEGVKADEMVSISWVAPRVVVQVAFLEWTTYDLLRQATYLGLREDKRPSDVTRDGA